MEQSTSPYLLCPTRAIMNRLFYTLFFIVYEYEHLSEAEIMRGGRLAINDRLF